VTVDATAAGHRARGAPRRMSGRSALAALSVGALGVVFGDVGTSPLYAIQM
jgi:KUP system potassium uptake protein